MRGFTLNYRNTQRLNFDSIKQLVICMEPGITIAIENPSKITRDGKRRKVINRYEKKLYKVVYDKRLLKEDYSTVPYGFKILERNV